ncbi:hypothetical protein OSB04_023358 [Centaurea solstitialis]|uniref:HMA domain-containing protein n=1 Tax=Centaurea solstitialis TaxID=347529 RepID=A0AA38WCU1_9ASTR|nr:hypothetical protein OSB04_023358 [Centaurea solstitialis]
MKIKTAELFCASPASTAICTSMNQHAMVRRGTTTPKPINHHHHRHHHNHYYNNHYQFDFGDNNKPKFKIPTIPCTSQHHIDPKPFTAYLQKHRKSTSSAATAVAVVSGGDDGGAVVARRKSGADINNDDRDGPRGSSSRYLLNNPIFADDFKDSGDVNAGAMVVSEPAWPEYEYDSPARIKKSLSSSRRGYESPALVKSRSSSLRLEAPAESPGSKALRSRSRSRDQVVELRVSIHCKGCEGKVRKHISRMEGVRSFHIDLESKKVTVVGDVTPLSVLSSISKVKNAQFWPSPSPTSASASPTPFVAIGY